MNACHFISGIRNTFLCALTLCFIDLSSVLMLQDFAELTDVKPGRL